MNYEDKKLLLQDLSARLPYGVICDCLHDYHATASAVDAKDLTVYYYYCDEWESIEHCKPYLRPMSSMTEEEWQEYQDLKMTDWVEGDINGVFINAGTITDWLNKYHFDYRGLIEKGLAIEAPNDMYKI